MISPRSRNWSRGDVTVWILTFVAVAVVAFFLSKGWDEVINNGIDGKAITVTGSFTCLPYKGLDTQNANCVLGIKSAGGLFYGFDTTHIQDVDPNLTPQNAIAVTGLVVELDNLGKAHVATTTDWMKYDVAGVIKVNTLLRTR